MVSPPKPWERNGASGAASIASTSVPSSPTTTTPASSAQAPPPTATTPPSIPDRPAALSSSPTPMTSSTTPYSSTYGAAGTSPYNRFGSSYGGLGSYGSYGGYNSLGTYGGMGSYGGYSGYGSYGGYGGIGGMGYGGLGGMGYGGMAGGPMGMGGIGAMGGMQPQFDIHGNPIPPSLTQTLESTTHTTFALLHSIVQTFTGVAQMLESTFMATHSSFFAMVGVVDQFSQLRNAIGSVLGLFGLVRWLKDTITGRPNTAMGGEFRDFVQGKPILPSTHPHANPQSQTQIQKANKKPLFIFLLAIFGIPYAMHKLIKLLSERALAQQQQNQSQILSNIAHLPPHIQAQHLPPLDPSQLQFARALYPFQASNPNELNLKENEIVAIMAKLDPRTGMEVDPRVVLHADGASSNANASAVGNGNGSASGEMVVVEGEWWKGRTREGKEGWFPRKWVEVLERKSGEQKKVD